MALQPTIASPTGHCTSLRLGAGVHFPKSFQKFAMAESKKKFLEIYALWLYGQGVQENSLKSIVSVIRDPRSIARVRPHYHLRITIKT